MLGIRVSQYPQGCHLLLFFDLTGTSKHQKAQNCEFGSDSAVQLIHWECGKGLEQRCSELRAHLALGQFHLGINP